MSILKHNNKPGKIVYRFLRLILILLVCSSVFADPVANSTVSISYPIASHHYHVLLQGEQLPSLIGAPVGSLSFYKVQDGQLRPIPFQIDRKDHKGRFQIPDSRKDREKEWYARLDENDEVLFMASDLGARLSSRPENLAFDPSVEIAFNDPSSALQGWVYGFQNPGRGLEENLADYVQYDPVEDRVDAQTYGITFSESLPFLVTSLQWKGEGSNAISPNMLKSMLLSHTGKFLHRIPFLRTEKDYTSELIAVKDGPIRVIRRTANRVRMFLGIGSPRVYMDYLLYPSGFVMDIIVDFPFKIGLIFSDVGTKALLALEDNPVLQPFTAYSESQLSGLLVNGSTASSRDAFNNSKDTTLILSGPLGQLITDVAMEEHSPIETQTLVAADQREVDHDLKGDEVAAVGFDMTKWEKLNSQTHHILFRAYLLNGLSPKESLVFMRDVPP